MTTTLKDIRSTYLNFFEKNGHKVLPSSSLIPNNDPSLMFTNSGMVQFKNIFTGNETAQYKRATTSQKCVRAGGKHNDLDNVGHTVRHHTFFEMLGNFSFGDYFKEDAIAWAWELLTKEYCMPKDKLAITVYHNDDEAYNIWKKVAGLPDDRMIRIATKDNFWQMGDTGPCGPCSEIFFDHGEKVWGGLPGTAEEDGDRWIEIWNLVFDQFEDLPDGSRIPIKSPSIDTGMGLERFSAILQGVHSNYEVDIFQNIIGSIANIANSDPEGPNKVSHNVIADHLRAMCFLIADGVLPSNEGRGYVLRRIMRRAMRHAQILGVKDPMIYKLIPTLQKEMGEAYPELYRANALITETVKNEEGRFIKTLDKGLKLLDDEVANFKDGDELSGQTAFKLYDTYGFPLDLTQDALRNKNIKVDTDGFNNAMEKQKAEARKSWSGSGDAGTEKIWFELQDKLANCEFLGYSSLQADATITALVQNGKVVDKVEDGEFFLLSNQTPFYAEMGGQSGDIGTIYSNTAEVSVTDTKKKLNGLSIHCCRLVSGSVTTSDNLTFKVDPTHRNLICANHSVTHIVHKALRDVLGEHVSQKGSFVSADRMRFDISNPRQISSEELETIESIVNQAIRNNYKAITTIMTPEEAINKGAMALFGEKYGEEVRVVSFEKDGETYSTELCGGTHVLATGDIGYFTIISESAIGAGLRRLECLTGKSAEDYIKNMKDKLHRITTNLKTNANDLETKITQLLEDKKKLEQDVFNLKKSLVSNKSNSNNNDVEVINGTNFVGKALENVQAKELKAFIDELSKNIGSGVFVLATNNDGKASIVVGISKDLTDKYSAVDLVRIGSEIVGGKGGGGRADMAQAGGPDGSKIKDAIAKIKEAI